MKVRMNATVTGLRNGKPWPARGEVVDLPKQEATELCSSGVAVPVTEDETETAQAPQDDVEKRETEPKRAKKTS